MTLFDHITHVIMAEEKKRKLVSPDTEQDHIGQIREITLRIDALREKAARLEVDIVDLKRKARASDVTSKAACQTFGNSFLFSDQPFDDFRRNWRQGMQMLQLLDETKTLEEQKWRVEQEWMETHRQIGRLQGEMDMHAELI